MKDLGWHKINVEGTVSWVNSLLSPRHSGRYSWEGSICFCFFLSAKSKHETGLCLSPLDLLGYLGLPTIKPEADLSQPPGVSPPILQLVPTMLPVLHLASRAVITQQGLSLIDLLQLRSLALEGDSERSTQLMQSYFNAVEGRREFE